MKTRQMFQLFGMALDSIPIALFWFLLLNIEHQRNMKCGRFKQFEHSLHLPIFLWGFRRRCLFFIQLLLLLLLPFIYLSFHWISGGADLLLNIYFERIHAVSMFAKNILLFVFFFFALIIFLFQKDLFVKITRQLKERICRHAMHFFFPDLKETDRFTSDKSDYSY